MFVQICRVVCLFVLCTAALAGDAVYLDIDGKWRTAEPYVLKRAEARTHLTKRALDITVTYEDVDNASGAGFDDPTSGAARRDTLEAVLSYIGTVLANSGGLDVHVLASLNAGNGSTPLAQAGPFFSGGVSGFQNGAAFTHITTGVDPLPGTPDVQMTVDFGHPFHTGAGAPPANQYDLYSVLLHEMTHGLGMISVVQSNGTTSLHSGFDAMMATGTGAFLFDENAAFIGTADMLVGKEQGLFFNGPAVNAVLGTAPGLYAPAQFTLGSSLSHWTTGSIASTMQPVNAPGTQQRTYGDFEVAMLADLGYAVDLTYDLVFTWVSNSADFESTVVVNNPGPDQTDFTLTARRADGSSETSAVQTLAPGGFFQAAAEDLFTNLGQGGGYTVTLTSGSPHLVGRWVTNDRPAQTPSQGLAVRRTLLPTQRAGRNLNLGYLPGNPDFQSAPVLVNMGTSALDMTVRFYDGGGTLVNTVTFAAVPPLTPKVVGVVGAADGDQYAVASADGLMTGVVFVFNAQNQTAIGNATTLAGYRPPN